MVLRRLKALMVKEFFQIIRDTSTFLISFLLPVILLFIYGFGVSLDIEHLRLGLVMEDTSAKAQSFVQSFIGSKYFDVTLARDRREIEDDLQKGYIRGMVIIPSYFSSFADRRDTLAPILVVADGTEPNTANFVQNYTQAAWLNWLQQQVISDRTKGMPLVGMENRFWYNEELLSRNFLIPGSLAIIMTLIGVLLTALVVAREWERGTMEALMSTPVTIVEIVLGKLIPYFILGFISLSLAASFAVGVYDVPLRGSVFALALTSGLFLFAALGLGLWISTASRNQVIASQASLVMGFLPAFLLSGFIFEISSMPVAIQAITYLLPARYFVSALKTIFLAGDVWPLLIVDMIPMFLIGLAWFYLTARRTVKRLD